MTGVATGLYNQCHTPAMRILITGAAGYLGSQLCHYLRNSGHQLFGLDNLSTGLAENWAACTQIPCDLRDANAADMALRTVEPNCVIHLASLSEVRTHVPAETYHLNNVVGTQNLLKAMALSSTRHMITISSACVYGPGAATPLTETSPLQAISAYGRNKLDIERLLAQATDLHSVILRPFVISGFLENYSGAKSKPYERHLIPSICRVGASHAGTPLRINGSNWPTADGTCVRDFIHVADVCSAIELSLDHLANGGSNVTLNLGTGRGTSILSALATYSRLTGRDVPYAFTSANPADASILIADTSRAAQILHWKPRFNFEDILQSEIAAEQRIIGYSLSA